jgi:hypothetical protein
MHGGCFCGFVRYEADGQPFDLTNCHCSICRRCSGAPFLPWFSVTMANFRFTAGQPATIRSSDHGTRGFCPTCGTQLTFTSTQFPDQIDVTICSLDDPESVRPRDDTRTSSALRWICLDESLPHFPEARDAGADRS